MTRHCRIEMVGIRQEHVFLTSQGNSHGACAARRNRRCLDCSTRVRSCDLILPSRRRKCLARRAGAWCNEIARLVLSGREPPFGDPLRGSGEIDAPDQIFRGRSERTTVWTCPANADRALEDFVQARGRPDRSKRPSQSSSLRSELNRERRFVRCETVRGDNGLRSRCHESPGDSE